MTPTEPLRPPPPAAVPPLPDRSRPGRPAPQPSAGLRVVLVLVGGLLTFALLSITTFTVADSLGRTTDVTPVAFGPSIRAIRIDVHNGGVVLRGGAHDDVRGERRSTHGMEVPTFHEDVADGVLTITGGCAVPFGPWCSSSYTLDVPAGVAVDATSGAGRIEVNGLTGNVKLRSGAGSVIVDDVGGQLDARSGAGSVQATRLRSTIVVADAGAGSVNLQFVVPPEQVKASAGAGSVDIEVPRDETTYRVPLTGRSAGDVFDIATNPESPRSIDAEAGAGRVRVHYPAR